MPNLFDFHTHTTLKPYHNKDQNGDFPNPDHWDEPAFETMTEQVYNRVVDSLVPQIILRAQSYLQAYHCGNGRCICISLYPLEYGFVKTRNYLRISQGLISFLINVFNNDSLKIKLKLRKVLAAVVGIHHEKVKILYDRGYNYYHDLVGETDNLLRQIPREYEGQLIVPVVVKDYQQILNLDLSTHLVFILSIEGVHSFISTTHLPKKVNVRNLHQRRYRKYLPQIYQQTVQNILDFKSKYPLFLITFAHHFYNLFCGHARSIPGLLFNQRAKYFRQGITSQGYQLLDVLLDRQLENGQRLPRVLIDTKHMSVQSRIDYHRFIGKKRNAGDDIPIIQTHTAVSGRKSMYVHDLSTGFVEDPIEGEVMAENADTLVTIALNLFDDEIIDILRTGGLIGIMLDEKRILGKRFPTFTPQSQYTLTNKQGKSKSYLIKSPSSYKEAKKRLGKYLFRQKYNSLHREDSQDPDIQDTRLKIRARTQDNIDQIRNALKPMLCSLFLNQLFHIARVYQDHAALDDAGNVIVEKAGKVWSHICIGSDFDGVINPLDAYPDASYLQEFVNDLSRFWQSHLQVSEFNQYLFGFTPAEIVEKIAWSNAMGFLKKYFSMKYRYGTLVV